ncbi:MAG: UDP-3-O-(3-hydroxymyristoyl)glucosamine N-acyltransferase [Rhodocyclaceae bacterium]|nr:UDP-3-O-(3-hydroxymyristoyl)glucosamine N-acyltransferase [Rhodocyclaceae bacterium]
MGEIVAQLGGRLNADPAIVVTGVAPLDSADASQLSFLANPKYRSALERSAAAAVIVTAQGDAPPGRACILADDPYLYFARVARLFHPAPTLNPGIHPSASVAADVPSSASIGPAAVVEVGAQIGEAVSIGPGCVVGAGVRLGRGTRLVANVTIYEACEIGEDCLIHAGAVIGADGFGFAREASGAWVKIPQIGRVIIGNDVEIGANTSIDRGAMDDTVIGHGVKLDNQIQIGHNVHIGDFTAIAGCVGIAGSTRIGARCMIGGQAGIIGHLNIADDVTISAGTLVTKSITGKGVYTANLPLQTHAEWIRNFSRLRHLDAMAAKIRELEKKLDKGDGPS